MPDTPFFTPTSTCMLLVQALRYFSGTMDEFEQREGEAATAQGHRLDARVRQEKAARASAEKMHVTAAKTGNDKVRQIAKYTPSPLPLLPRTLQYHHRSHSSAH